MPCPCPVCHQLHRERAVPNFCPDRHRHHVCFYI
jgi:hypothetical protein